jgi:hypothetical protein
MKTIEELQKHLCSGHFEFSRHAFKRAVERNISELEIREVGKNIKMIEYYPEDKYTPSGLLLGLTTSGRPIHLHVSLADTENVKIITLYEPNKDDWTDYCKRR